MRAALFLGYAFLYIPVLLLVATSFNPSRLTTVLTGFSFRWYAALWANDKLIEAALLSLRIAAVSATGATILGTAAGYALARFGRFRGRTLFAGLLSARLVLPDVLVGLSLLLLFVQMEQAFGWPDGRGAATITLAHISVSLAYVAVVIEARLADGGIDLEEAAMDLGAAPAQAFLRVTASACSPRRCCLVGCSPSPSRSTTSWSRPSPPAPAAARCRWSSSPPSAWGSPRS